MVFSRSLSNVQLLKLLFIGILKAEFNVFPFMLNAAFPVGAAFKSQMLSGFSPGILFRYLSSAWYRENDTWACIEMEFLFECLT